MSEHVKKEKNPLIIDGITTFKKNDSAPDFVVCDGVLTPKLLFEHLKKHSDLLADAKGEYKGNVQYKFQITTNDYGTLTFKFNVYKAPEKGDNVSAKGGDDLPF